MSAKWLDDILLDGDKIVYIASSIVINDNLFG